MASARIERSNAVYGVFIDEGLFDEVYWGGSHYLSIHGGYVDKFSRLGESKSSIGSIVLSTVTNNIDQSVCLECGAIHSVCYTGGRAIPVR